MRGSSAPLAALLLVCAFAAADAFILFFPDHMRPSSPEDDVVVLPEMSLAELVRDVVVEPITAAPEDVQQRSYVRRRSAAERMYSCPCRHKLCTGNECPM